MLNCQEVLSVSPRDPLWRDWENLMERAQPGMQIFRPHWYSIWAKTIGETKPWAGGLDAIAVRDGGGQLQGVLPFGWAKMGPVRLRVSGGYWQPWRSIVASADHEFEVGRALGNWVAQSGWSAFQFGPAPRSSQAILGFRSALDEHRVFCHSKLSLRLPVAIVPDTWDEYQDNVLGKSFCKRIEYYERRLKKMAAVRVDHYRTLSENQTERMLADLSTIEGRSWLAKESRNHLRFVGDVNRAFWRQLIASQLSPSDQIDCWILSVGERPVSFCLTLTDGSRRYVLANNYDEEFAKHSTGSILYHKMVEDGIARGVRHFDFGTGDLHYKSKWGASNQDVLDTVAVFPNRWIAKAVSSIYSLKELSDSYRKYRRNQHAAKLPQVSVETQSISAKHELNEDKKIASRYGKQQVNHSQS